MSKELLEIKDLHVNAGEKEILKGLNLKINKGEVHVIMGPNGAGKSTLANVILNNPEYTKTSGTVEFEGENINDLSTDKIAKKGIFMSFQLPEEIPGISTMNFLKYAKNKITEKPVKVFEFRDTVKKYSEELNMNPKLIERNLNVGFSGGDVSLPAVPKLPKHKGRLYDLHLEERKAFKFKLKEEQKERILDLFENSNLSLEDLQQGSRYQRFIRLAEILSVGQKTKESYPLTTEAFRKVRNQVRKGKPDGTPKIRTWHSRVNGDF